MMTRLHILLVERSAKNYIETGSNVFTITVAKVMFLVCRNSKREHNENQILIHTEKIGAKEAHLISL